MILKIVSGGQTGVDRAALNFALANGLACGGWCPKGRRAKDGKIASRYPLVDCEDKRYKIRTERNALDSDATLILNLGRLSAGTALTARLASENQRPLLVLDLGEWLAREPMVSWLEANAIAVLNIAGPRESQRKGIGMLAYDFLSRVWNGSLPHEG